MPHCNERQAERGSADPQRNSQQTGQPHLAFGTAAGRETRAPWPTPKARYVMIGGFLGAGKTTAVAKLARELAGTGLRVGLITNDQGQNLVDTAMFRSQGFATEEIPGGCFCCRFNSLLEAAEKLTARARPEVFVAEPVGSCTDLLATVTYPLRRIYGDKFEVAPVSVLVDPVRASRVFGLEKGGTFSAKVLYIYKKQLEEADLLIISKRELLDPERLESLRQAIALEFPGKEIMAVSVKTEENLRAWFDKLTGREQAGRTAMAVDYELYAQGEALLGWLNCAAQVSARKAFDTGKFLKELAGQVQARLNAAQAEVAHLKMTLSPDSGLGEIAAVNLVRNDFVPELSQELEEPVKSGQLIINLRAEAPPELLGSIVREALAVISRAFPTLQQNIEHIEQFRPGKPVPTHRFQAVEARCQ